MNANRWLDRSQRARTSGSSCSSRTNIVGTHWLWVTRWRSISSRALRGVNFGMITLVAPTRCAMAL